MTQLSKQRREITKFQVLTTTLTHNCKSFIAIFTSSVKYVCQLYRMRTRNNNRNIVPIAQMFMFQATFPLSKLVIVQGPVSRKSRDFSACISVDIILFVSSKRRRLEARNFAVIFIFIPFTTYEKTSFTE